MTNFAHGLIFIQVKNVDAELHEETVDGFAGYDPKAFAFGQGRVLEQPCAPGFAGVSDRRRGRQYLSLRLISHNDFQSLVYNTKPAI